MMLFRYVAPRGNWYTTAATFALGCGYIACNAPAQNPVQGTSTKTSTATALPTTDATSTLARGGAAREALNFPFDAALEFYPLERALLVTRVVQERPAGAQTPGFELGLELHLVGTANPPPPAALHAGLPRASNPTYVHERVRNFVGRWPDAAYAIVLDDPGDPQKLAERTVSDHAPAQLFHWTGESWSAAAPFTNVASAVAAGGGLLATRSLQRGSRDEALMMFAGYEFASALGAKAPRPALPVYPPGSVMSGLAAARIYWPERLIIGVRPRALDAPLLAATPQGDLFVGGCDIPAWVKYLRAQQSPSSRTLRIEELQVCPQFAIEHFRPNVETSTIYSLDNPGDNWSSRFEPMALTARAANDVYFAASERHVAQETYLMHYDGTQWAPMSVPTGMRNTIAMALTPLALWVLAVRAEPGKIIGVEHLALWRMDWHGQNATWGAISLPREAEPIAVAAAGTSVWVSAFVPGYGDRILVYELTE